MNIWQAAILIYFIIELLVQARTHGMQITRSFWSMVYHTILVFVILYFGGFWTGL